MRSSEIPAFGPLSGIRVICPGVATASPFAATMMSDFGADVIFVESPFVMDQYRTTDTLGYINKERRNQRCIALNVADPEGQDALLKLVETADIFLENSKAGVWDKRGLTDEVLWEHNPKLVICHVTGFGLTGDPETLKRGSYDAIGQAMSGWLNLNGDPDGSPMPGAAYICDYVVAILASWACLAAYIKAQKTGVGESIDVAQYEAMMLLSSSWPMDWFQYRVERKRGGSKSPTFAGCGVYPCLDGNIYVFFLGTPVLKRGLPFFGLEFGSELFPEDKYAVFKGTPGAPVLEAKMREFCASRTVLEADAELAEVGIPASAILTYAQMEDHPHFLARETLMEWDGIEGEPVKGLAITPRFRNNPGQVWCAARHYGEDNEDLLSEVGYSTQDIQGLYERGILRQNLKK